MITTLVGLNPGTVMKHGPTAAVLSVGKLGRAICQSSPWNVLRSTRATGESNWQFAIKNSLELQRRDRNWAENTVWLCDRGVGSRRQANPNAPEDHGAILEACGVVRYDIRGANLAVNERSLMLVLLMAMRCTKLTDLSAGPMVQLRSLPEPR